MNGKTVSVGVRVTPETRDELIAIARAERRTVSQIVAFMIEEALERRAKRKRPRGK